MEMSDFLARFIPQLEKFRQQSFYVCNQETRNCDERNLQKRQVIRSDLGTYPRLGTNKRGFFVSFCDKDLPQVYYIDKKSCQEPCQNPSNLPSSLFPQTFVAPNVSSYLSTKEIPTIYTVSKGVTKSLKQTSSPLIRTRGGLDCSHVLSDSKSYPKTDMDYCLKTEVCEKWMMDFINRVFDNASTASEGTNVHLYLVSCDLKESTIVDCLAHANKRFQISGVYDAGIRMFLEMLENSRNQEGKWVFIPSRDTAKTKIQNSICPWLKSNPLNDLAFVFGSKTGKSPKPSNWIHFFKIDPASIKVLGFPGGIPWFIGFLRSTPLIRENLQRKRRAETIVIG